MTSEDYKQKKQANQKHRWTQFQNNVKLLEEYDLVGMDISATRQDESTWIFVVDGKPAVHFYPTKNAWRICDQAKQPGHEGGIRKFIPWMVAYKKEGAGNG